jgi:hypothetical protein
MINAKSIPLAFAVTAAVAAAAAPTATARVADAPLRGGLVSTSSTADHAVPPRVDGIGVQPDRPTGVLAVPVTRPSQRRGFSWPTAAIAVVAVLGLMLLGLARWSTVHRGRRSPA